MRQALLLLAIYSPVLLALFVGVGWMVFKPPTKRKFHKWQCTPTRGYRGR